MSSDGLHECLLPLDERNFAHVLSSMAFAALASRIPEARGFESTCWWNQGFVLKTAISERVLFGAADEFVRGVRWVSGVGAAQDGTFVAKGEIGSNPFISLAAGGKDKSPLKTFSGQLNPEGLLSEQQASLAPPSSDASWLKQSAVDVGSWGFDSRVGSHAYDLGFSSNEEGSGDRDPIYPAVELLSITAASFFAAVQGWQLNEDTIGYSAWTRPISLSLAPYAIAGGLEGFPARQYGITNWASSYGKGKNYKFFPEATLITQKEKNSARNRRKRS